MAPSEHIRPGMHRTVGILLFDDVEVLDFSGPFEVFFAARREGETDDDPGLFDVVTIAEDMRLVRCSGGLLVQPQYTINDHPSLDLLVVPGGDGTRREIHNRRLVHWITDLNRRTEITISICTGAFLLAESGILDGLQATTHWYRLDGMGNLYPAVQWVDGVRLVDTGHVVTSAGISAGIDLALHVVERLHGQAAAVWTAHRMEHLWSEQYRRIFESSADAILIVDPEGRIAEANGTACRLFGYSRDALLGMPVAALTAHELDAEVGIHLAAVRRAGAAEVRAVGQRSDGSRFPAELRSTTFEYHGLAHVLSMVRDITARVEAEEIVRQERQRLSRELHDSVSQSLYSIALGARTARALAGRGADALAAPLDLILEQAERGLAEMRALIFELRPEALEQEGLVAAVSRRAAALQAQYQLVFDLALCAEPAAPFAVKEALYRIAQEAMHNALKHAQATKIRVLLACVDGSIELEIQDNGKGFDPEGSFPGHLGLQSMRERATQLGGTLRTESAPGMGTAIIVRIPVHTGVPAGAPAVR